jgi:hypothetical protein
LTAALRVRNISDTMRTTNGTPKQQATAYHRFHQELSREERANTCGDMNGLVGSTPCVCTIHKGHAGSHYDGVAAMAWTGDRCPECLGVVERLVRLDAGALTVGQYRACLRCASKGRIARAA